MRLPLMEGKGEEKRRVLCGRDGCFAVGEQGQDAHIVAEGLDLAHLPLLVPQKPRTCLEGFTGEVLQFFSNGDSVCMITRESGAYHACIWDDARHTLWGFRLPEPREKAFLYAHAFRGKRLFLPAFSVMVDLDARVAAQTDQSLVSGEAAMEYNETLAAKNRHTVSFSKGDFSQYRVGEYVLVKYRRLDEAFERELLLQIVVANSSTGTFTLEGEGAPDLLNARPETVSMAYDIPSLNGIFADHERLYGFSRNRIYISAKGDAPCFTPLELHDTKTAARVIEMDAEVTGGCMYRGKPYFFTDGAVIRVMEDSELGFHVSVTPTVGVTPRAAVSPVVVGDKICYFSRHGLALFDGKSARVVRSGFTQPKGGVAVADGRFYNFVVSESRGEILYAYDTERDLLYERGDIGQLGVAYGLGGVLIATEYTGVDTRLVMFCERDALPYPISQMLIDGLLFEVASVTEGAKLVLGDVREGISCCSPVALEVDARVEENAALSVSLFLENESDPYVSFTLDATGKRTLYRLPCLPRRCESWHVELSGTGNFCVFTVTAVSRA